jgi:hypothetical protein
VDRPDTADEERLADGAGDTTAADAKTLVFSPFSEFSAGTPKDLRVTYKAEDEQLGYAYVHRFTLLGSGKMSYKETVDLYDRRTHRVVGTARQRALLHRLTATSEKRLFAQPSSRDVFKSELSTSKRIHAR